MAVGTRTGSEQPASPDTRSSMAMRPLVISVAIPSKSAGVGAGGVVEIVPQAPTRNTAARTRITAAGPRVGRDIASEAITGRTNAPTALRWRLVSKVDVSQRPSRH